MCCCSVAQSYPTLCNLMDCSTPASLSFPISWSLLKLMSIELVMPSNHLILCHPFIFCLQSFPASGSFPMSWFFASGRQSIGASASASVFPMNIQDWFPLGWTGWISLQSKGLSRVFSNTTVQSINSLALSFLYSGTSLVAQMVKHLSTMQETQVRALGWEDPLEKEMAIHSSTIA